MNDAELIARLRAWEPLVSGGYEAPAAGQPMHEAATRLETLTAELKTVLDREAASYFRHHQKIETLTAENERLKLELESAKDMFDRHVEWASEQNAVVVCPRAIPPLNYCTDCDGSFPCHLQALEKQP